MIPLIPMNEAPSWSTRFLAMERDHTAAQQEKGNE